MTFRFEWDQAKNLANQRKHGLSFEEAIQVFQDPLVSATQDRIENGEYRWQALGFVRGALALVAYTVWNEDDEDAKEASEVIRPISARPATPKERRRYEQENG
ncbi:MAG: BrnT family toxin [Burkholderiaceae bacterium]|jgi:uncharacterized DUF497 family protein|nr:BrnT family toxin [Burkholderiaceae bacterium]